MDNAKLIIYDTNWEEIGIIDAYTSLIWTKRYTSCGDFELHLPFRKNYVQILKLNNFVCLDKEMSDVIQYAMIIEHIEINQSAEDGVTMIVKGRSLLSILYRRVLYDDITGFNGNNLNKRTIFQFICDLVNSCFDATNNARKLDGGLNSGYAIYNRTYDTTQKIYTAGKGENLGEAITKFCETTGTGIDMLHDSGGYSLYVYKLESKENSVIFSSGLDNLANCSYVEDISNYANVVRITADKVTTTAPSGSDGNNATYKGLGRYEKALSSSVQINDQSSNILSSLRANGMYQLREYSTTQEITAEIINTKTYCYEVDYRVGDVVKIITDFGITVVAQIKAMTESWSVEGYNLIPTFSNYKILDAEDE